MANTYRMGILERAGQWLGGVCRKFLRGEPRLTRYFIESGETLTVRALLWIATLVFVAALMYTAFWITLAVIGAFLLTRIITRTGRTAEDSEWDLDNPHDHRERLFYHPQDHNDDPDPRWQYQDSRSGNRLG